MALDLVHFEDRMDGGGFRATATQIEGRPAMTVATAEGVSLSHLGQVPASYVHEWRVAEAMEPLITPRAVFKWYEVRRQGAVIPRELDAEARALLTAICAREDFDVSYGLNFAVLHYSTKN